MAPSVFLVLVGDAEGGQMGVEGAVFFDEKIVHAAINPQGGETGAVDLLVVVCLRLLVLGR